MTLRRFHFATAAQWNTCLFVQADGGALRTQGSVQPFAAYGREPTRLASQGAYAPAVTRGEDILWRDGQGCLLRLSPCDDAPERSGAPDAIGRAQRIVAALSGLWVVALGGDSLHRYEEDTLSRVLTVDLRGATAIDIADAGRGRVLALVTRGDELQALTIDPAGHVVNTITLRGMSNATAVVFLRRSQQIVVLGGGCEQRLYWFAFPADPQASNATRDERRPLFSRVIPALHPCFEAGVLGSDGRDRLFLAGSDGPAFGASAWVLILDADGNFLGDVPIDAADAPATGVLASRGALFVSGRRGLLRFDTADVVPEGAGELRTMFLTPMLSAPDREDRRRWLRIDATADLPEGSTLEIAFAASADREVRDRLVRMANDTRTTASERVAAIRSEPDVWHVPTVFHGRAASGTPEADPFSAKLFEATDPYVWVLVTLSAAPGARLPRLSTLDVLYPGRSLMESLPGIYQREEERPDSFLRPLVGVLEATTQGLDTRIKGLSGRLAPATASEPWLDFVAKWLGVPWDEAMSVDQKRRILANAPAIMRDRGTRTGLETLLDSLLPAAPPRFRVTDATADFGFVLVGNDACTGSALPAMLGGRTRWATELGRDAVLDHMRLPCPGEQEDGVRHLSGRIRVEIAATGEERRAWEPWLVGVLRDMVPLAARLELRWVTQRAFRGDRLDGTLTLDGTPEAQLGTGAIISVARLPERGGRLSRSGPALSTRLR